MNINTHKFEYQHLLKKLGSSHLVGQWLRNRVDVHGFLILQDLNSETSNLSCAKNFLADLSSSIGTLVSHNPNKQDYIWEIKAQVSNSEIKTFSENNQLAPLHTDSQYRIRPEQYMALMVIRQASCGGGATLLLDFKNVLEEISSYASGKELLEFAKKQKFPIAVPSVFQTSSEQKYIYSSLISDSPLIRYRYDTLKTGISLVNSDRASEFLDCLETLNNYIQSSSHQYTFNLSEGEVIFVDNHRFLHGRTSFIDPQRLLLRSRFN